MSDNFPVQQEALLRTKDLVSSVSAELSDFGIDRQATAPPGLLESLTSMLKKISEEGRLASEEDFHEFIKISQAGKAEMEFITGWVENRSALTDRIHKPILELSASMLLSGSEPVIGAVNAYLKVVGAYIMFSLPKASLKMIKDERVARENVFAAVGKALREGPFAQ